MKKAGMIALVLATVGMAALGIACGDKGAQQPTNPEGTGSATSTSTATSTGTGTGAATGTTSAAPTTT